MIRFGWETFKKRPWFFIGAFLIVMIISGIASQLTGALNNETPIDTSRLIVGVISVIVGLAISMLIKMGNINFLLTAHDAPESAQIFDLWAPHPFWKYVFASILVGVIVIVGVILLIVPGIIWGLRYMFVPYLVMERKLDVSAALKESARMTYGHKWQLFGFVLAIAGLNILGAICLVVGLLVSIPVTSLAFVHAYRILSTNAATPAVG